MTGILCVLAGSAGAPRIQLTTPVTVSFSSGGLTNARTSYQVNSDSFVYTGLGAATITYTKQEQWDSVPSTVGNYEVRATVSGGVTPSGSATGSWLNLGTTQAWTVVSTPGNTNTSSLTIEIRAVGTTTVLATSSVTLTSDAT